MNRTLGLMPVVAIAVSVSSFAATPRLRVVETVTVSAPVDTVWAKIKDFDSLDKWHPALAKDEIVSGTNNKPGAIRQVTVKDGSTVKEQLVSFSDTRHSFTYTIIESALPIIDYRSTVTVKEGKTGTTVVRWSGTFKRKNPADDPPESENDAAGVALVKRIYRGGLSNLKKMFDSNEASMRPRGS